MHRIMLVLGGGGIRGLAHIGVLKALERLGIPIAEYAGTSVGAIVAAMAASGMSAARIEQIGVSIRQKDIFDFQYSSLLTSPRRITSLCKGERLRQLITRIIPVTRFDEVQTPLVVSGVDIGSGQSVFWGMDDDRDLSLHDAIYASCAIPGIFPPQKIRGALYIDGGVAESLPLHLARIRKPDLIIAVNLNSLRPVDDEEILEHGILSIMERFYEIKNRELLERRRDNQAETPLIVIEPDVGEYRFFKVCHAQELIDKGEAKALAVLKSYATLIVSNGVTDDVTRGGAPCPVHDAVV